MQSRCTIPRQDPNWEPTVPGVLTSAFTTAPPGDGEGDKGEMGEREDGNSAAKLETRTVDVAATKEGR